MIDLTANWNGTDIITRIKTEVHPHKLPFELFKYPWDQYGMKVSTMTDTLHKEGYCQSLISDRQTLPMHWAIGKVRYSFTSVANVWCLNVLLPWDRVTSMFLLGKKNYTFRAII